MTRLRLILSLGLLCLPMLTWAHKPSDSYLFLQASNTDSWQLRWDIALRDLEQAVGLDTNQDGRITWGELQQQQTTVQAYALSHLRLRQGEQACQLQVTGLQTDTHTDGAYAVLFINTHCTANATQPLHISYQLLFELDPTHRGILLDQRSGAGATSHIFSREQTELAVTTQAYGFGRVFVNYVHDGITHILAGFDHLLFITLLILPSVLVLKQRQWCEVESFRPALSNLLKVITAFTVAHSITLSLAVLGFIELPSRLVESAIALSIIVVAVNILYPIISHDQWKLAFAFGLLHGFGFASVLMDMQMPLGTLTPALVGFNIGVELGQLLLVSVLFPLAYMLRTTRFYQVSVLHGAAVITLLLASAWLIERAFNTRLLTL